MLEVEVLIGELGAVDGLSTGSVVGCIRVRWRYSEVRKEGRCAMKGGQKDGRRAGNPWSAVLGVHGINPNSKQRASKTHR